MVKCGASVLLDNQTLKPKLLDEFVMGQFFVGTAAWNVDMNLKHGISGTKIQEFSEFVMEFS